MGCLLPGPKCCPLKRRRHDIASCWFKYIAVLFNANTLPLYLNEAYYSAYLELYISILSYVILIQDCSGTFSCISLPYNLANSKEWFIFKYLQGTARLRFEINSEGESKGVPDLFNSTKTLNLCGH